MIELFDLSYSKVNGNIYAWGDNSDGQLGVGNTNPLTQYYPTLVQPVAGLSNVIQISGGGYHSLALLSKNLVCHSL